MCYSFIIKQIRKILAWELTKCFLIAIASGGILESFVIKRYLWYLLVNWLVFCLDHNLWKTWLDTQCYIIKLFGCKNCLYVWLGFSVFILLMCSMKSEEAVGILILYLYFFPFFLTCQTDLISAVTAQSCWVDLACLVNPFRYITSVTQCWEQASSKYKVLFCFEK